MKLYLVHVVVGALVTLRAAVASAQSLNSVAVDATTAFGQGRGGVYRDRGIGGVRVAVSGRHRVSSSVSVFGEVAMEWLAISVGDDALCVPRPDGGCIDTYPELAGPAARFGVLAHPNRRLEFRASAGGAAYAARGTRVGALVGQLDATVFPFQRFGFLVGGHSALVPRYRGDRLTTNTLMFGVRFR